MKYFVLLLAMGLAFAATSSRINNGVEKVRHVYRRQTGGMVTGIRPGIGIITGTGLGSGTVPCFDKLPNCYEYARAGVCTDRKYSEWVRENCAHSCSICFIGTGTIYTGNTNTIASRSIMYRILTQPASCTGDKAGVNCESYGPTVCTDTIYAGWVADNCCLHCMVHRGSSGTHVTGIFEPLAVCVFKGQVYMQGQTWKDGCQYKCTCVDANSGYYKCQALCVQWQLPDACTLNQPAPGKCCQTPNCPSNVNQQYPPNYVAE